MKGKRIAVTGGFGALGRAVVTEIEAAGATAIAIDLAPVPDGWSGKAFGGVDISRPDRAAETLKQIDADGGLDGIANIAGGFAWETVGGGDVATWDRLYTMNVRTAAIMCQAAIPFLKASGGAIVNVGANAAMKAGTGMGAYTASKAGVHKLTEALAEELKDEGVRVNAVLPSILDTPANRADMGEADAARWVKPEALAKVIRFLLSNEASAVTGALVPVTGRV